MPSAENVIFATLFYKRLFNVGSLWDVRMSRFLFLPQLPKSQPVTLVKGAEELQHYDEARTCVEDLALYLKPLSNTRGLQNVPAQYHNDAHDYYYDD